MIEIVKVVLDTYISTHNAGVEISNLLEMMPKLHAMKVDLAKIGLNNIYDPTIESLTVRHDILLGSVKNIVESGVLNGLLEPQFKEYFLQNSGSMKSKE